LKPDLKLHLPSPENYFSNPRARLSKRALIPVVCILALVLVLFFVLRSLFPSDRLRELAIAKLEETSGLSITVEDAAISFVHWRIGVKVFGIEVSAPVDRGSRQLARLATIPQLGIVVSILPLLKKEIVVDELYVERPQIGLKLGGEPILRRPPGKPAAAPAPMPMSFSLSKAVVNDADIQVQDVRSGNAIELKHLDASSSVRADKSTEILLFEGKCSVKGISVSPAKKLPFEIPPLDVKSSWKARFSIKDKLLELERISVRVSDFPIEAAGKVDLAGEKPDLDVKVKIEKVAAEKLLALVPKEFLKRAGGVRIEGQVEAYTSIRGKMPSPEVDVEKFAVSVGGSSVSGRALVKTQEPRSVDFESTGNLKLDELARALAVTKGPRITSGTASFHITGGGLINELKANPLSLQAQGEASVNSVGVELPQPFPPVMLDKANLILSGRSVEITGVTARAGSSIFNATGRVRDWKERSVELEVRSPMLDLGELLLPIAKQQKASKKEGAKMAMPAGGIPAKGTAKLQVDKLKFGNFDAKDLNAQVVFGGDSIVVSDVTMNTLGGKCSGKSRLFLPKEGARAYRASFSADNLEMKELLNSFTPVKDFMSGLSFFEISVEGKLPEDTSPLKSVAAKGQVKTTEAKAIASPLVSAIASWVGLEEKKEYALRDFATSFLVQDGRVILPQCRLEEKNSMWDFAGSTGFDGTLDYKVNVTLSQEYSKRTGSLKGLDQLLKDDQGRVMLDLVMGGTVKKPTFRWDSTRMQQRAKELLGQKVRGQLEAQTKKGEELKQEVKRELEKKSDTLKVETAKKGVKLLEELLKKRKK
jgi:hypothetical protein